MVTCHHLGVNDGWRGEAVLIAQHLALAEGSRTQNALKNCSPFGFGPSGSSIIRVNILPERIANWSRKRRWVR